MWDTRRTHCAVLHRTSSQHEPIRRRAKNPLPRASGVGNDGAHSKYLSSTTDWPFVDTRTKFTINSVWESR
jgi:hypothetical protein